MDSHLEWIVQDGHADWFVSLFSVSQLIAITLWIATLGTRRVNTPPENSHLANWLIGHHADRARPRPGGYAAQCPSTAATPSTITLFGESVSPAPAVHQVDDQLVFLASGDHFEPAAMHRPSPPKRCQPLDQLADELAQQRVVAEEVVSEDRTMDSDD